MNNNAHLSDTISLLKKDESHVRNLTDKYPWCSVAQLYLLHHYKKNSSFLFEKEAGKTALYFNSSAWLSWQLYMLSEEEKAENQQTETKIQNILPENKQVGENATVDKVDTNRPSPPTSNEDVIAFEPLHTIDYFASQGIKITEEPVTNDKLGNQMKSFTEWLKSMKKVHKENIPAGDEQTDKTIQRIAEHSNADAEIVTEAMADILIKQDKHEKAIEVYEKLSLQNPSKSGYFAAKINSLKAT
jgi:hypothetical protein